MWGFSTVRKTDRALDKGDDVVVWFSEAKIEAITERVEKIVGPGKGSSILVQRGTNNAEREGTTAIVRKCRQLVRRVKQTRVEQIILSGILPVMGSRGQGYRNCQRITINTLVYVDALLGGLICTRGIGFILVERVQLYLLMNHQQQSTVAWEA